MTEQPIRFADGAAYEQAMGVWSRLAGNIFLDWLAPRSGLRWIDVGCGNGAFTELLIERCAPTEVQGIDPSEGQLAYARERLAGRAAQFQKGDAMALPFPEQSFDAALMALVIFFVPDPARSVAEMARVVRPGGMVATYAWDMLGGGFPQAQFRVVMGEMGLSPPVPPNSAASRMDALRELWAAAGLEGLETREITVQRTFADFDDYWTINLMGASISPFVAKLSAAEVERLKSGLRARLPADAAGRITYSSRANAIKGRVPT